MSRNSNSSSDIIHTQHKVKELLLQYYSIVYCKTVSHTGHKKDSHLFCNMLIIKFGLLNTYKLTLASAGEYPWDSA